MVMAIWQTGITWAPTEHQMRTDVEGAAEHVATHFAAWTRRLARSITLHKNQPDTIDARRRSGSHFGQHGLTPEEQQARSARHRAERDYYQTVDLQNQIRRGAREYTTVNVMKMLEGLRNGNLRRLMDEARAKCRPVQAPLFTVQPSASSLW